MPEGETAMHADSDGEDDRANPSERTGMLRTLWRLSAGQRLRYGAATAALVVASCFLYLAPLVPQVVLDGVITDRPRAASASTTWLVGLLGGRTFLAGNLWLPCLLVAGLTGLAGVFTYLRRRWSAQASEGIVRRVRDTVYDHLQRLPCTYFDGAETGDLIQRCTSDVETLRVFLSTQVVEIGRALVMLLIPIPLMLAIDAGMTLVSLTLIPGIFLFSLVFFRKVKATFLDTDEAEGRMTATIQENLTGIRVVRAFARQDHEQTRFGERNGAHRDLHYKLYKLLAGFWSASDMLCFLQKAIVVGAGIYWLAQGTLLVGAFFYFLTAVGMFMWPVRHMGRILTDLGKAVVALGRLEEVLEQAQESADEEPAEVTPLRGDIAFENVSFAHAAAPVLNDVSFSVQAGETLAILGPSGSGKTTIVNLLLRLYEYQTGSITVDGRELAEIPRGQMRANTAVVMQEPFLYSKRLGENVSLGRPEASQQEIVEATSAACVHGSILEFEDGYETLVGERGVTLSGGQRQRIALARALLQQPAILILDDALSAVDTRTEANILKALEERHGRHTTIVIAHRLSALKHADRILVLEEGRVVQSGTHRSLLAEEGLYQRLWDIQTATPAKAETLRDRAGQALASSA